MSRSNPGINWQSFDPFRSKPEQILANRKAGQIYSADFSSGEGKYISSTIGSDEPIDAVVKVSPRIEVRLTYIIQEDRVSGVQISKLNTNGTIDKIHLSTLDWDGVLALLYIFNGVDMKSVATGSLILDRSIVSDPVQLEKFLNTVATDPQGKNKLEEVAANFGLLKSGDVDRVTSRKKSLDLMDRLLNNQEFFQAYKLEHKIGKDEEIWQQLFQDNDWMLGSDVVEILDERVLNEHNTVDLPVKSVDGFLDIIELKLPTAPFWTAENNPNAELTKALMQCIRYLNEAEKKANDYDKIKELGCDIVKPRITLTYGRSIDWHGEQHKQLRILNASFHNITILTYDHVLQRAKRLIGFEDISGAEQ